MTAKSLRQGIAKHLKDMDKSKMSLLDLQTYTYIVKLLDEMEKPSYAETLFGAIANKNKEGEKDA